MIIALALYLGSFERDEQPPLPSKHAFPQSSEPLGKVTVFVMTKNGLNERRIAPVAPGETVLEVLAFSRTRCDQRSKALLLSPSRLDLFIRPVDLQALCVGEMTNLFAVTAGDILFIWE
jgi:hypothetical protein